MLEKMYLASIRPKYVYRIFTGVKKFELRKWIGIRPPRGSVVVVYASGSVRAIVGEFRVGRVFFARPNDIWNVLMTMDKPGVGVEDYQYIRGARYAIAIEIINPILYVKPIPLNDIRSIIPGFMPPMSIRELDVNEPLYELIIRKAREATFNQLSKKSI